MKLLKRAAAILLIATSCACALNAQVKTSWTTPLEPFQIADNLYYVGSQDLAAYLITTSAGNILINANLPSSPAQIRSSVEKLGFRWSDTKLLLVGQAHFDHAGGAAQVLQETHASLAVMEYDAEVVAAGGRNDFLLASGAIATYPPAHVNRVLHDGGTVTLGGLTLTAHRTGGHTRGCTTWTMRTHVPGEPARSLRDVVIVGGYTMWADYKLLQTEQAQASYPGIADDFKRTFAVYRKLPCDIFLADHGDHFGLLEKVARMQKEGDAVWIDPQGYAKTIEAGQHSFEKYLSEQRSIQTN
ncbi:MAG: subclass B3 metallo-beta-lactamase [Janthinobacterium lividum]